MVVGESRVPSSPFVVFSTSFLGILIANSKAVSFYFSHHAPNLKIDVQMHQLSVRISVRSANQLQPMSSRGNRSVREKHFGSVATMTSITSEPKWRLRFTVDNYLGGIKRYPIKNSERRNDKGNNIDTPA